VVTPTPETIQRIDNGQPQAALPPDKADGHTGKAIAKYLGVSRTTLDASEDLSAQILNNPDLSQKLLDELVPIIYKGIEGDGINAQLGTVVS
jgi:hypothetical protein